MSDPYRLNQRKTTLRKRHPEAQSIEVKVVDVDDDYVDIIYLVDNTAERIIKNVGRPWGEVLARKQQRTVSMTQAAFEKAIEDAEERGYNRGKNEAEDEGCLWPASGCHS